MLETPGFAYVNHNMYPKIENVTVSELIANQRGGKSATVLLNGKPIRLNLKSLTTPFECSAYDKESSRKSLDTRANDELQAWCQQLDKKILPFATKLGCKEANYKSLLKEQKEGYAPLFRQKITISAEGKSPCKFFEAGSKRRLADKEVSELSWVDLEFNCMCKISSLYVNGPNWGLVATPEAILCRQTDACPFTDSGEEGGGE